MLNVRRSDWKLENTDTEETGTETVAGLHQWLHASIEPSSPFAIRRNLS
jgi:hypothetical protein